jgi:DNA mismatch endonuclease (patch repair protein)
MKYIRDGRAPIPESEITSKIMSRIRGKHTKPELMLRKSLREMDLAGYRLHWKKALGRPDIAYPNHKVAIFVNGCFWHQCPYCKPPLPKSHVNFWKKKFQKNKERDAIKVRALEAEGWRVLTFWECKIKKDSRSCAQKVKSLLSQK